MLPLQSNVAEQSETYRAHNIRKAFAPQAQIIIGTFSSFKEEKSVDNLIKMVAQTLPKDPNRHWIFLGRNSEYIVEEINKKYPEIKNQISKTSDLDKIALSTHVQACDIMVQPYEKGVDTSRSSIMVSLSHGLPVITNASFRSEKIWQESDCAIVVPNNSAELMLEEIENLITDEPRRLELKLRAKKTFHKYFSLQKTIDKILTLAPK